MPRDKQPDHEPDLFDKLFGDPAALADDELNMLYEALSPGTDPSAIVHRIAEEAAVEYRKRNRMPPDHVQATLDATREIRSLDDAAPKKRKAAKSKSNVSQPRKTGGGRATHAGTYYQNRVSAWWAVLILA